MAINSIIEAEEIIKREKEFLLEVITQTSINEFQNDRIFFPLFEEKAKYDIKKLKLNKEQEKHYINLITDIYGEYSDDQPSNNPNESYYSNFYFR
ncbi:MAG: hypothetical protein ACMXX8_02725 [Candidatus Woesearchaeota archaeon]